MPKEYIVKLVFDRNHESMVILKNNQKVIGGICFREFKEERFAEIAFLAITSTEQIRGFGTRLMNKLKCTYLSKSRVNATPKSLIPHDICRQLGIRILPQARLQQGLPYAQREMERLH